MMQYQVPQFIEVEDKIFGPLTLKQFIYLAGGGGVCLIFFTILPLYIGIPLMIPVVALSLGLAFFQVNGRPLIHAAEHASKYLFGYKLYLWQQRQIKAQEAQALANPAAVSELVPKLSQSKLKDLAWSLNIKDRSTGTSKTAERSGFEI